MAFLTTTRTAPPTSLDFHVRLELRRSGASRARRLRGAIYWKYAYVTETYDPVSGATGQILPPARQHLLAHMHWWMTFYHLDGYRLGSVQQHHNYDFIDTFRAEARKVFRERWQAEDTRQRPRSRSTFLTIGESRPDPPPSSPASTLYGTTNSAIVCATPSSAATLRTSHPSSVDRAQR